MNKLLIQLPKDDGDPISIRSLFGGTGVCCNGIMFGWIYNDELYLRGHAEYLPMFMNLKMEPLRLDIGVTAKLLQYYKVTDILWHDEERLLNIIQMVIKYSHFDKVSKRQVKESRIKDLPNMTSSLERALFKAGIINVECFKQIGPYESYFKLKQCNRNISKNILFVLYSALAKVHVATLSDEEKYRLKEAYNKFVVNQNKAI